MSLFRFALVDIETTGLHVTRDFITEIALIIVTEQGIESQWHSLIKPPCLIPAIVSTLTGITNSMVSTAPTFSEISAELITHLQGCLLVAHNARFDFGFLKNAFKREAISYQSSMLCTVKLMKSLYPGLPKYNLIELAQHFGITNPFSHRAQGDVQTLYQLLTQTFVDFSVPQVLEQAKKIYQKSSIPSKLTTDIHTFPDSPGVYIFYSSNSSIPLYIGKSITLRQRILSHFQSDHAHAKEFAMAQQIERVEIIPTAGELSALLLESELIKEKMPIYNRKLRRKTQIVGFKLLEKNGYFSLSIVREQIEEESDLKEQGIYGAFRSVNAAKSTLLSLIKKFRLCNKLCHIESCKGACFSFQLKSCFGACIGEEKAVTYNERVIEALKEYQEEMWPFDGPIAIKEYCPINNLTQFLLFDEWRHLGTLTDESKLSSWKQLPQKNRSYYYDAYKILSSHIKNKVDLMPILV